MTVRADLWRIGAPLAAFFAFAQFRVIAFILGPDYSRSVDAALGVVTGHPHWRVYQSRVLGPYIVEALSWIMPSYLMAHVAFSISTLAVAGFLAFRIGRVHGGDVRAGLLAFLTMQVAFVLLLSRPWLYAWDYLDLIGFLVFADFVLAKRGADWFAVLYAVAIWNRDSAQFIALWMIVEGALRRDRHTIGMGVGCGIAGALLMEGLRRVLLVQEIGPLIFKDSQTSSVNALFGITWPANLHEIGAAFRIDPFMPLAVPVILLLFVAMAGWVTPRLRAYGIVYLVMAIAELLFAVLYETRTMIAFIPLAVTATVVSTVRPRKVP